jgi:hypothetical protein
MQEKSKAQSWVEALEWAIYQGFEKAARWVGQQLPEDFDITLFKDSSLVAGKATDLPILLQMVQQRHISLPSFLREVKARGVLVTIDDIDEEVEIIRTEAEQAVQRQMEALANRMIGERPPEDGDEQPPQEGQVDTGAAPDVTDKDKAPTREKPEEEDDDDVSKEAKPEAEEPVTTVNELTLGIERLRRAGNLQGANQLLIKLGEMLGVKATMGKVAPPPAEEEPKP